MKLMIKMPVRVYVGFLGRLTVESREYAVVKAAVIESHSPGDHTVSILCDEPEGILLLRRANEFYPEAGVWIQQALDAQCSPPDK